MARNCTFKGEALTLAGRELHVGDKLPNFKLTGLDMNDISNSDFAGKVLVISVVPSLDTPVCSIQTKHFNQEASRLSSDVSILTVSMDLPFAQKRWCGHENVDKLILASDYKYRGFGEDFGTYIQELGLLSRAVFVADAMGILQHVQYVAEISSEPDYESALSVVRKILG